MEPISYWVKCLAEYGIAHKLIRREDTVYIINSLLDTLHLSEYEETSLPPETDLETILKALCDHAARSGLLEMDSVVCRDLFDTRLMGILTPRPSAVIDRFHALYKVSPEAATDDYYRFSCATDYIRTYRVKRDLKWSVPSEFGDIDITINLSKPEKDPRAIAAAKNAPQAGYPKCALCRETEGYAGSLTAAARQNHRLIPMTLDGAPWYFQYSPYVYYNEHCIVLSGDHTPMKIDGGTFRRMLDFVTILPHYFIGSNADLPIVGGSILSHDHMQGGRYTFAMERAPIELPLVFRGFDNVQAGIVRWPLSVIRLRSSDRRALEELSMKILRLWRGYTDESAFIFSETDGAAHNTITPIARRRGTDYEMDLVLRNNITTEEHPLGVYHPHKELHNIKKENIGLIEVMGLAVLPARLKSEMAALREAILDGRDISADETLAKHAAWLNAFRDNYRFTPENTEEILHAEIGRTFVRVLCDAGVYKTDGAGRQAFLAFADAVNAAE
ncbi:MAG: UDP-glucose--hexose-1-phosphate uridylyltransferase [Eubacteriales bacterium]